MRCLLVIAAVVACVGAHGYHYHNHDNDHDHDHDHDHYHDEDAHAEAYPETRDDDEYYYQTTTVMPTTRKWRNYYNRHTTSMSNILAGRGSGEAYNYGGRGGNKYGKKWGGKHERKGSYNYGDKKAYENDGGYKKECPLEKKTEPMLQHINTTYHKMIYLPSMYADEGKERTKLVKWFVLTAKEILYGSESEDEGHRYGEHHGYGHKKYDSYESKDWDDKSYWRGKYNKYHHSAQAGGFFSQYINGWLGPGAECPATKIENHISKILQCAFAEGGNINFINLGASMMSPGWEGKQSGLAQALNKITSCMYSGGTSKTFFSNMNFDTMAANMFSSGEDGGKGTPTLPGLLGDLIGRTLGLTESKEEAKGLMQFVGGLFGYCEKGVDKVIDEQESYGRDGSEEYDFEATKMDMNKDIYGTNEEESGNIPQAPGPGW